MRCWVLAFALVACGDVNKGVLDGGMPDAYQADSPPAVNCAANETVCNGATCADMMSDELNCGACNNQCAPTQACASGTCLPANISCPRVREIDPAAPDGAFHNPQTGKDFYCNFTTNKMYELGLGQYNVAYTGYTLMSVAAFDVAMQDAFLGIYNLTGGLVTIAPFMSGLCCVTQANNLELQFGGAFLSLAQNGVNACNINYNGIYQIMRTQDMNGIQTPPLPADYFTTNPVGETAQCGDTNNIGLFFKVTAF